MVKILDSNDSKPGLDKVDVAAVQIDKDKRKNVLSHLTSFADLFGGTLGNVILLSLT